MYSPGQEHFEEVRERLADDPSHTFAEHLQCLLAERDARLHPLPADPTTDEDRHRWIAHIAATRFLSYADAAGAFTRDILPQLRKRIADEKRAREVRQEQAELARRVAAVQPQRVPTAAERRMNERLAKKYADRDAAAKKKAALVETDDPEAA